jgi:hypothetical protein
VQGLVLWPTPHTYIHLSIPSGLFPFTFPTNILFAFFLSSMACPSHPLWLE